MARSLAAARALMVPDPDRTVGVIGDTHTGKCGPDAPGGVVGLSQRMVSFRTGWNTTGPLQPRVAATLHAGDLCEGETGTTGQLPATQAEQIPIAKTWFDGFNDTPRRVCYGNHDDNVPYSQDLMAAAWGQPKNDYVDLDFARIINCEYTSFGGAVRTFVEDTIESTDLPSLLLTHIPENGVLSANPGTGHANIVPVPQMTAGQTTNMDAVIAAHPKLKAILTGHSHSWYDTPGLVTKRTSGANSVAHVNASAITYVGASAEWFYDPLYGYYVTLLEDDSTVEVRIRDHGNSCWIAWPSATRVATVTGL